LFTLTLTLSRQGRKGEGRQFFLRGAAPLAMTEKEILRQAQDERIKRLKMNGEDKL
jgi:hypothetical protein